MSGIYLGLWTFTYGDMKKEDGTLSDNFLEWSEKTKHLKDEQLKAGFEEINNRAKKAAADGKEFYVVSIIQFIGICEAGSSPNGINGAAYKVFKSNKALVDKTKLEARKVESKKQMGSIKNLMGMK